MGATQRNHMTGQPVQLQPFAVFQVAQHRGLHRRGHGVGKGDAARDHVVGQQNAFGAATAAASAMQSW